MELLAFAGEYFILVTTTKPESASKAGRLIMKIFSRDFWGTVLIWAGVIIFLVVIYDLIRPVFPDRAPYPFVESIQSFFSRRERPRERPEPATRPARRPPPERPPIPRDERMLTTTTYSPGDHYRQWVWAVKPEHRTGPTVRVEAAHAAAGGEGGFRLVAYADTSGDGMPDRLTAESDFLTASRPGEWSVFTFSAGDVPLFVGCSWEDENTVIFRGNGEWPEKDFPLEGRFFYLVDGPGSRSAGPAHSNVRVSFSD